MGPLRCRGAAGVLGRFSTTADLGPATRELISLSMKDFYPILREEGLPMRVMFLLLTTVRMILVWGSWLFWGRQRQSALPPASTPHLRRTNRGRLNTLAVACPAG